MTAPRPAFRFTGYRRGVSSIEPQHAPTDDEAGAPRREPGKMSFDMKVVLVIVAVLFLSFVVGGLF